MSTYDKEFLLGYETAFINKQTNSNPNFCPEFVSNDPDQGRKVISTIEQELSNCDEFAISVAFITLGGIESLLQVLRELEAKNIKGKILTTDYQIFTDPKALDKLHELKNIEIKMYITDDGNDGFHTKGYLFKKDGLYRIIIGSSNMTDKALTVNREWNTKLVGYESGEVVSNILSEFNNLWNAENSLEYDDFIENYRVRFELAKAQRKIAAEQSQTALDELRLEPNKMQKKFTDNVLDLIKQGQTKALLVSATGTGKTYASAFAIREMKPKKVLFLAHRERILKQSIQSYKNVFGRKYTYEILSGNTSSNLENIKKADFVFSTMQTMSRDDILNSFNQDDFSVICLDEAHHAGAPSYKKIMDYFKPNFWLGMTASPDTNRFDVYAIFDHNIAYELRLQEALEQNLLCPFHYFGIRDLTIEGDDIDESSDDVDSVRRFRFLTSDDRVDYVIKQTKYYGYSGNRVKGLVFCSEKNEARELSRKFNERGYRTVALTGEDPDNVRADAIERLVMDPSNDEESKERLDYIFTIDVFSEGVDIPEVNQVIMLRPTQSAIVFVQQLGRGLRKFEDKEFVVVLDFIGNYKSNFLIPIALSGDNSYNKDNVRRYLSEGDRVIPGCSTIHFDEISKKRIFDAIDRANFSDLKLIIENYTNLKYKLGRIPKLSEFDEYGEMDVCRIFDNKSCGSYYKFLTKHEKDYHVRLSEDQEQVVEFISKELASGKRIHELEMLRLLINGYTHDVLNVVSKSLEETYHISLNDNSKQSLVKMLTNNFLISNKARYKACVFIEKNQNDYDISDSFREMLKNDYFSDILKELVDFGISRYKANFSHHYEGTDLVLYQKYTYKDVSRLLNLERDLSSVMNGYWYNKDTNTYSVFINYDKDEGISETTKYKDHFLSPSKLIAMSKSNRTLESSDVQKFIHAKENGTDVHLFVRKTKKEKGSGALEFYYLGRMFLDGEPKQTKMNNNTTDVVEFEWELKNAVKDNIYHYLTN